jgi:hypothetical protein
VLELHHRCAPAERVEADERAVVFGTVDGRALDEPRRDRERVTPEDDPVFGVAPVALGRMRDAGEGEGV